MSIDIYLTNNLTNKKEKFVPIDKDNIRMYVCGPTVYDDPHIGNARPIVVFDILYKIFKNNYPIVTYVRNITDVDDKIIKSSKENQDAISCRAINNGAKMESRCRCGTYKRANRFCQLLGEGKHPRRLLQSGRWPRSVMLAKPERISKMLPRQPRGQKLSRITFKLHGGARCERRELKF